MENNNQKTGGGKDQDHSADMTLLQALKELLTTQKAMAMHLARLDDRLDSTRADIILIVEQVYARVRREEMWQKVMCSNDNISHPAVMAMKATDHAEDNTDRASQTLAPHVKGHPNEGDTWAWY